MSYQPLPHDSVAPPPSGILPNTYPDSHAVWTIDVDAGSGQRHGDAVMEPDTPPPPPEPEREPITVTTGAAWADLNDYSIGSEVFSDVAAYEGGNAETTTYRYRWQTKATAEDAWTNGKWTNYDDHAMEVSTTITELGQLRFQCQARDTSVDPVEQVNSFTPVKTVNTPSALVVSTPVVTGNAYVGQTLSCSEPTVSGGVGPYQIDYFWVDESNVIVWEATYMGSTTTIVSYDLGKNMKCLVTVTDKGYAKGESTTVESNSIGPIEQPSMGQPRPYIDDEIYDPNAEQPYGVKEEQSIELRVDLPNNVFGQPSWNWDVRQGDARLSPNGPYCVMFNNTAMGSPVAVQVDMIDNNCSDSPHSIRYTMFVTTASKELEA